MYWPRGAPLWKTCRKLLSSKKRTLSPPWSKVLALGGATGLLAGLVAIALPTGLVLGGGALFAITLAGAGVGALASSMIGSSIGNRRIEQFQEAIERGEFLLMVDVPRDRVEEIEAIIKKHHPEAECARAPTRTPFRSVLPHESQPGFSDSTRSWNC